MREGLESYLASTAFIDSGTTNPRRLIRGHLESHPLSNYHQSLETQPGPNQRQSSGSHPTASSSFINAFDLSNVTFVPIKASAIGDLLWRGYYCHSRIKNLTSAACSLYEYTWEVVVCMVLTGKRRLGLDIWPATPQQAESIESMIRITWNAEAMWQQKICGKSNYPWVSTGKEAKHVRELLFYD